MAENKWVCLRLFYPHKWSYGPLLITGFPGPTLGDWGVWEAKRLKIYQSKHPKPPHRAAVADLPTWHPQEVGQLLKWWQGRSTPCIGDGRPPTNKRVYKPLILGWWVYPLLYGNNGSLDPSTHDGNLRGPPQSYVYPQEIAGPNSRPYWGKAMGNSPLIRPAISWGSGIGRFPLGSHVVFFSGGDDFLSFTQRNVSEVVKVFHVDVPVYCILTNQ